MCTIRGKLKNRVWINNGDIILVGLREFGDDKGDAILKYYDEEAKELKELGEIPEHVKINEGDYEFEGEGDYGDEEDKDDDDLDIDNI